MMTIHTLKEHTTYFESLVNYERRFEVRKDDRNFKVGDTLHLHEFCPDTGKYSGRIITKDVAYKLVACFGLQEGYCILGFKDAYEYKLKDINQVMQFEFEVLELLDKYEYLLPSKIIAFLVRMARVLRWDNVVERLS